MNICIFSPGILPVVTYGGTERVIWDLGESLCRLGHSVWWLSPKESKFRCGTHIHFDSSRPVNDQIPPQIDCVHFHNIPSDSPTKPYLVTIHGNGSFGEQFDHNAVFVSKNHANRHGSESFVYNGLNWNDYPKPDFDSPRTRFHFLGKAAWRVKNVRGAIAIAATAGEHIDILGGDRFNFKMGVRITLTPRAHFHGMVGGDTKFNLMKHSKGLIFPVRWNEPFGLAITESLWFGSPVFGTPFGSLPELVTPEVGFLADNSRDLVNAIQNANSFNRPLCHERAHDLFHSDNMAQEYLRKYEQVLAGESLNQTKPTLIQPESVPFPFY